MTDFMATPDTLSNDHRNGNAKRPGESDLTDKWSWQRMVDRFWSHSEENGEMDTKSFRGLL